jgi:hypothetical protein
MVSTDYQTEIRFEHSLGSERRQLECLAAIL